MFLCKQISLSSDGGASEFTFNIGLSNPEHTNIVYPMPGQPPVLAADLVVWWVLNPGDFLVLFVDPVDVNYWVSGALLPEPPFILPSP